MSRRYVLPKRGVVGYEVVERYAGFATFRAELVFWLGDWNRQRILDRHYGTPAVRRCIATIRACVNGRYEYTTHAGPKGGWRHSTAPTYDAALAELDRWVQRRFTPKQ